VSTVPAIPVPFLVVAGDLNRDDVATVSKQLREVGALVLLPPAPDQVSLSVLDVRLEDLATRNLELELRQVLASELGRDVGRRERRVAILRFHDSSISRRQVVPDAPEPWPCPTRVLAQ
jgi:hypothetical protein